MSETVNKKKIIDKTFITSSGKDIRDSKMEGYFEVNISEMNQKIANKRIKYAKSVDADIAHHAQNYYVKGITLVKRK